MDLVASGDGETSVTVLLAVGNQAGPYVVLPAGDRLTATNGDTETRLALSSGRLPAVKVPTAVEQPS
jgi:hypothetical protein